jgi:FkbM family methyltransferase
MRIELLKRKILNAGALWISYIKLFPWLFRLNKDSVVIDCGANTGSISKYLSLTGATIYAFEPDPIAFKILSKRLANKKKVHCINKGVWNKNTTIQLYRHAEMNENEKDFTVSSSIIAGKSNISSTNSVEIEVISLVEFIKFLNKEIDLIKVDVEGAETEILKSIIEQDAHALFKTMYAETHETKIPGQKLELQKIKEQIRQKGITNIKLNWI